VLQPITAPRVETDFLSIPENQIQIKIQATSKEDEKENT